MNLYIFEYIGSYCAGGISIIADNPNEAKSIAEKSLVRSYNGKDEAGDPVNLTPWKEGEKEDWNEFYLIAELALRDTQEKGVIFKSYNCA